MFTFWVIFQFSDNFGWDGEGWEYEMFFSYPSDSLIRAISNTLAVKAFKLETRDCYL